MTQLSSALLLGLSEIAQLARVQRPVVSMWRSRSAGTDLPFPAPISTRRGRQMFDGREVVEWLTATGRGNNPSAAADLAAHADLDGVSPVADETTFLGISALLCLSAMCGRQFRELDSDDVLDLADEFDPDDDLLYREIEALGPNTAPLACYCDLLLDASFHAAAALERLIADRLRTQTAHPTVTFTDPALTLGAATALALAEDARLDQPTFIDPTPDGSDLLIAVARRAEGLDFSVATTAGDDPASRLARRRTRVHGLHRIALPTDWDGNRMPDPAVVLAQYPGPGRPGMTAAEVLDAIDDVVLRTADRHRVLVLAPASALTERLAEPASRALRDGLLRVGRLRAMVRLPPGLIVGRPRERLAMWCFGPMPAGASDSERRLLVGDLTTTPLDGPVIDDLVTDLVASVAPPQLARSHQPRFLRPMLARQLLARTGALVEPANIAAGAQPATAELVLRIRGLAESVRRPLPTPALPSVDVTSTASSAPAGSTFGAAVDRREIRVLPGHRLGEVDAVREGGVRLIGVEELSDAGDVGRRRVARLALIARYPMVRFTEPGDVVFCTAPRPIALVDREGGSVVAYPARIARISDPTSAGTSPWLLAADIAAVPETAKSWRAWSIRHAEPQSLAVLDQVLAQIHHEQAHLARRHRELDELARLLARGATSAAITITPTESTNAQLSAVSRGQ